MDQFLKYITSIVPHILFTTEDPNTNRSMPFLDTLVTPGSGHALLITVYRNPTHTDQVSALGQPPQPVCNVWCV